MTDNQHTVYLAAERRILCDGLCPSCDGEVVDHLDLYPRSSMPPGHLACAKHGVVFGDHSFMEDGLKINHSLFDLLFRSPKEGS
jgi:hypothetical protein